MKITEHFSWEETQCKCGCLMPESVKKTVQQTAQWAEAVRAALGSRPMTIHSWYRCPSYNKKVGGAAKSQHILGKAIDFTIKGMSPQHVQAVIFVTIYPKLVKGLGKYIRFTHIDWRDHPATWEG